MLGNGPVCVLSSVPHIVHQFGYAPDRLILNEQIDRPDDLLSQALTFRASLFHPIGHHNRDGHFPKKDSPLVVYRGQKQSVFEQDP
ncbi:hypothetical protein D3C72_2376840 [compost metagenome]